MVKTPILLLMTFIAGEFQTPPSYDPDRLSPSVMERLVAFPMKEVRAHRIDRGVAKLEKMRARTRGTDAQTELMRADLDESFGVLVYAEGLDSKHAPHAAIALPFLKRAIPSYRAALGLHNPEVALALQSWADVLLAVDAVSNVAQARDAYCEAFQIRFAALGWDNDQTDSALAEVFKLLPTDLISPAWADAIRPQLRANVRVDVVVISPRDVPRIAAAMKAEKAKREAAYKALASDPRFAAICSVATKGGAD